MLNTQIIIWFKASPRAWYQSLHNYVVKISFERIDDNNNLYLKIGGKYILPAEIFVDDIIFRGQDGLCKAFVNEMKKKFEMFMFGETRFLVGLQVYYTKYGIYITQSKYVKEILNFFGLDNSKLVSTPMVI